MQTCTDEDVHHALAMLDVPDLDTLTDDQTRGGTCVWCREELNAAAVDLGERMSKHSGVTSRMRWFPRADSACVYVHAMRAMHDHVPSCTPCGKAETLDQCAAARGLRRLMRDHRS